MAFFRSILNASLKVLPSSLTNMPKDIVSAITFVVCLLTGSCVFVQVFHRPGLWNTPISNTELVAKALLHPYMQVIGFSFPPHKASGGSPYTQYYVVALLATFLLRLGVLSWGKVRKVEKLCNAIDESGNSWKYHELRVLRDKHETAAILSELVDEDGAGAWPPRASHDSWPAALRPYKDIYLECSPLLPTAEASTDDNVNQQRRGRYRSTMQKLLQERIDIGEVEKIMKAVENGNWSACPRAAYNAFYCCVAVCRHAYR